MQSKSQGVGVGYQEEDRINYPPDDDDVEDNDIIDWDEEDEEELD